MTPWGSSADRPDNKDEFSKGEFWGAVLGIGGVVAVIAVAVWRFVG